ncbi:unnamed protein product [Brassicogethes aeneus]|uniref:Uncharacterized protein n=1 Tax=Brassicogethes aeneus TaxID=1431903 RepID=A0A9P0B5K8_BRAAE|nr:unnamed protein product [Brassicogethes aeneus]
MARESLTQEQLDFLDNCQVKFANRYTDEDPDYQKVFDTGIPTPPIVSPWYSRNRFNDRRGGQGGSNYNRNNRREYNSSDNNYKRYRN